MQVNRLSSNALPAFAPLTADAPRRPARTAELRSGYLDSRADQIASQPLDSAPIPGQEDVFAVMTEQVDVLSRQFDEMLAREIDSRKMRFPAAIKKSEAAYQAWQQAWDGTFSHNPSMTFKELVWHDASSATVSFTDENGKTFDIPVDEKHPDFTLLKNYQWVRDVRGPVDTLSAEVLDVLLQAPADSAGDSKPQVLEAYARARGFREASEALLALAKPGPGRWAPTLDYIKDPKSGKYFAFLANQDHPGQRKMVEVSDRTIILKLAQFKQFSEKQVQAVNKGLTLNEGQITPKEGVQPRAALEALQGLLGLDLLKSWLSPAGQQGGGDALLDTLQKHLTTAKNALGLADEALQLVELGAGANGVASVAAGAAKLRDVAGKAGVLLSAASLALSIAALVNAKPEERGDLVPQLVFDTAGLGLGIAGLAGGTVGGIASALAVPLAGISIGVGALYTHFSAIAQESISFGKVIQTMNDNLNAGGMAFDAETQALKPLEGVVIESLDLKNRQVGFGSPSIYPTQFRGGETGNVIGWVGNQPEVLHDRSRVIDIRERLGLAAQAALPDGALSATTVHLPATPKSLIDYRYRPFFGVTTRYDAGFELLRRMEGKGDFAFDFMCGHEQSAADVKYEYQQTTVKVALGSVGYRLQMPELSTPVRGKLHYALQAEGGQQVVGLMPGARLSLSSTSPKFTQWVLDARNLGSDSVSIDKDGLSVGGVRVDIPAGLQGTRVSVIDKKGAVIALDLSRQENNVSGKMLSRQALRA